MERKQQKITEVREDEVLTKDEYVLNRKKVNKIEIIKGLSKWVKQSFIFQNLTVHLPYEVELPIEAQIILYKLPYQDDEQLQTAVEVVKNWQENK